MLNRCQLLGISNVVESEQVQAIVALYSLVLTFKASFFGNRLLSLPINFPLLCLQLLTFFFCLCPIAFFQVALSHFSSSLFKGDFYN